MVENFQFGNKHVYGQNFLYGLYNSSGDDTMKIIVQKCSCIQRESPFSLQQIHFEQD